MVGRMAELQALQTAFNKVLEGGQLALVTLLAPAGMGKTRLLREFHLWLLAQTQTFHLLRGQAKPETRDKPFGLLASLLHGHCQIAFDATPAAALAQLEQAIVPWFVADDGADLAQAHAHMLGYLIGIDTSDSRHIQGILSEPRQIRQLAFNAAAQWLRRISAGGSAPVLLLIEDLHWADSESLDFLDYLRKFNSDTGLLVVATGRPELAQRRPTWTSTDGVVQRMDVGALDGAGQRQLVGDLLHRLPTISPALIERVTEGAEGHPFCIEERVKLLIDQGVIRAGLGEWTFSAPKLRAAKLPSSLAGVLKARLDLLPPDQRRTLEQASVIGPVFLHEALRALGGGAEPPIAELLRRDLTLPDNPAGADGTRQLSFKHQLLQEITYDNVPAITRRALHGKLARWLVGLTARVTDDLPGLSALHFEQAGDAELAAEQHARAAEQAAARFAAAAVSTHAQRGLALLDTLSSDHGKRELRWRLLSARVRVVELQVKGSQQLADIDALAAVADELADDGKRAFAAQRRAYFLMVRADYAGMKGAARQVMACAARAGDDRQRLGGLRMLALANCYMGDWDAGDRLARQCLAQASEMNFPRIEAACMNTLSMVAQQQQQLSARLHWHEQALALGRRTADRRTEAVELVNLGDTWLHLGEFALARRNLDEALRLARAIGHSLVEAGTLCVRSVLERWLGNGAQAVVLARSALAVTEATGMVQQQFIALQRLGEAEWAAGQPNAAAQTLARALALAHERKLTQQDDAAAGLARLALAEGDLAAALRHLQPVLDRAAAAGGVPDAEYPRRVELHCHLVLASADDPRAQAWLQRAHDNLMVSAATIADAALREGFLNNIPDHRAILAAWAVAQKELAPLP